jgi:hypothetical protein
MYWREELSNEERLNGWRLEALFFLRVTANAFRQSDPHVGPN